MANIRIKDLPADGAPKQTDLIPIDLGSTRHATVKAVVESGRPTASKTEAELGVEPQKAMTPLTVKQAIEAQVGSKFVTKTRKVNTNNGLTGGDELTGDVTLGLNAASLESLEKANTAVQTVNNTAPSPSGNVNVSGQEIRLKNNIQEASDDSYTDDVRFLQIAGYHAAGDGGAALYKRVSSEPSHAGKVQSADGAWWEYAPSFMDARKGSLIDRLKAAKPPQFGYLFGVDDNSFRIGWGYGRWERQGSSAVVQDRSIETAIRADADGLLRMRGAWTANLSVVGERAGNMSGSPTGSDTTSNYYTTTVGFNWSASFVGTGFKFRTLANNQGGIWRFTIDEGTPNQIERDVSVYSSSSSSFEIVVAAGLPYGRHTVKATFQGADPNNAPSDGTARGWFKYNSTDTTVYAVVPVGGQVRRSSGTQTLAMSENTVLEFAIRATPVGSAWSAEWVPNHGAGTVSRNIVRNFYVDGTELVGAVRFAASAIPFKTFSVVQQYSAYNAHDTSATIKMWDGILTHTYYADGTVEVVHEFVTAVDLHISVGYMAMLAGENNIFGRFITDAGDYVGVTGDGTSRRLPRPVRGLALVTQGGGNYVLAMDVSSDREAVRLDRRGAGDKSGVYLVQNENGNIKAYLQAFDNEVVAAGSRFSVLNRYYFGVLNPLTYWL